MFKKFKINPDPIIVVFLLGFGGLVFTLIDNSGEIGSKVPIALFFLIIMIIAIVYKMYPKDKLNDIYGQMGGGREIA